MTGGVNGEWVTVEGVYVPEQISGPGMTQISAEEVVKAGREIIYGGKRIVGFVQYNGSLKEPFESPVTKGARENLARQTGGPNLGVVIGSEGDYKVFQEE